MGYSEEERTTRTGTTLRALQALDALIYGGAVVALLVSVSAVVSFPVGWGWVGVKVALFFVGFLFFGVSALQLRPKPPWKREESDGDSESGKRKETHFQVLVQRIPPLGRYGLAPDERLSPATKLFVASVLVLAVSYVMEAGFGVAA